MIKKYDYDAVIIGAGISGLICGCYLAKAGIKTLIVEKNSKPGGYCTSFKKKGFHFDACVHSLGSLREGGNIRVILRELGVEDQLQIVRHDPSDIIVAPDHKINFWSNLDKTISEFQSNFPAEKKTVRSFFNYINECKGMSLAALRSVTFQALLDRYFRDERIKAVLSLPVLGNAGLPASKISALTGALIYKEFMLDGGYYPGESIQSFADALMKRFKAFGGYVHLSSLVKKIKLRNRKIEGVEIEKKGFYSARYVISNADATLTFLHMIGEQDISNNVQNKLTQLKPSLSMFILYLGMSEYFKNHNTLRSNTNVWLLPYYDINKMFTFATEGDIDNLDWFLLRLLSDKRSMLVLVNAPFLNHNYWKVNKKRLTDVFIKKAERIVPNLSSYIEFKDSATPTTLHNWTLNHKGAAYGWAGIPSQLAVTGFTQRTSFENLYLTGHWTTLAQGISGVAHLGRDTSQKIIKKLLKASK